MTSPFEALASIPTAAAVSTPIPGHWPEWLLLGLMLAYPLYGALTFRRTRRMLESGLLPRTQAYTEIILVQWATVAVLAIIWAFRGRSLDLLGLGPSPAVSAWVLVAWAGTAAAVALLAYQVWSVGHDEESRSQVREQAGDLGPFLPVTRGQVWSFGALSVTAGICEEILFRGFLLWWFQEALGSGLISAAASSTVLFGLCHAYQGWQGILRTGFVGAVLMAIRLAAGTLWPVILLHILGDIASGWMVYRARDGAEPGEDGMTTVEVVC